MGFEKSAEECIRQNPGTRSSVTAQQAKKLEEMLTNPQVSADIQVVSASDAEVLEILKKLETEHALEHKLLK
jgi:hypothetical protein